MPLQMAIVIRLHMRIVMVILMVTMEMMLMDEVLHILLRMMIIVTAMVIESLSNGDFDGYEHVKQFVIAKQWHCTCITIFWYISLTFTTRPEREPS